MRALLLATLLLAGAAFAQDQPRVETVHFEDGKSSKTVKETVRGGESVDHRVQAHAGQVLTVKLDSTKAYFNILEPGSADVAIYNSSMDTNAWTGTLKRSGAYTVRVYQMRNNARRGNADYTRVVRIAAPRVVAHLVHAHGVGAAAFERAGPRIGVHRRVVDGHVRRAGLQDVEVGLRRIELHRQHLACVRIDAVVDRFTAVHGLLDGLRRLAVLEMHGLH